MCGVSRAFEIEVPASQQDEQVSIGGLNGYYYYEITRADRCITSEPMRPLPSSVAVNKYGYHLTDYTEEAAPENTDIHITFKIVAENMPPPVVEPEKPAAGIPFTAKIGEKVLNVKEIANAEHYGCYVRHTFEIEVPESLKDESVTLKGVEEYYYTEIQSADNCGSFMQPLPATVAVNQYGYHLNDMNVCS